MTAGAPVTFDYANPRGGKLACSVCHRTGYGVRTADALDVVTFGYAPWQRKCRAGHAQCPDCGQWMALRLDGEPYTHTRCPVAHPERRGSLVSTRAAV